METDPRLLSFNHACSRLGLGGPPSTVLVVFPWLRRTYPQYRFRTPYTAFSDQECALWVQAAADPPADLRRLLDRFENRVRRYF